MLVRGRRQRIKLSLVDKLKKVECSRLTEVRTDWSGRLGALKGHRQPWSLKSWRKRRFFFNGFLLFSDSFYPGSNLAWLQHPPAHFFFLICVVQHQVLYTGQTVLKEIRRVSSSGWWTCKSLWFGTDSPNCIQPLTTIVSLQPPSSIRTSTRTGTWVHTGGEEVAGFTSCRGLAQGPSYDWLGDWDMSLSMISFTVKGDKQKKNINKYSKL